MPALTLNGVRLGRGKERLPVAEDVFAEGERSPCAR